MFKLSNLIPLIIICLFSCKQKQNPQVLPSDSLTVKHIGSTKVKPQQYADTIKINFEQHKDILKIIPLLPDSAMGSWEWKKDERIKTIDFIKAHHYFIDTTKLYNNIKVIKSYYFRTQVVDGSWSISAYKIENDHFIVITNDMVGDGNDLNVYEFDQNTLKPIGIKNILGDYFQELLVDKQGEQCTKTLEDNEITFSYDFERKDLIEISSDYFSKKENSDCLKGNTLKYQFNTTLKKFELIEILWK
ncbi:hypothetical protein [Pedobacter miscanthi]|uniref:hypothetical protein n=1 Tax=Pedobacter miscanthi TaxID=2259170 RepID=UPI002931877B|nr:hypothetical protein [Pedobacter miscanthi]